MKIAMSPAAAALVRALLARAGGDRNRILLREVRSVDWQSLTFIGERHRISLRVTGPEARAVACRMTEGIEDADFRIAGHFVADVVSVGEPLGDADGSVSVELEVLTVAE